MVHTDPSERRQEVASSERLEFVFSQLLGGNNNAAELEDRARDMGWTGDDLAWLQQQDVDELLSDKSSSSLQRRKMMYICQFLNKGGVLYHGMTMADIYNHNNKGSSASSSTNKPSQVSTTSTTIQQHHDDRMTDEENGPHESTTTNSIKQETSQSSRNWLDEAQNVIYNMQGQVRQIQQLAQQGKSLASSVTACFG